MDLKLNGKRALVTGSSRGLGYATARGLAHEGATVAINSRHAEQIHAAAQMLSDECHVQVLGVEGDLAEADTPKKLVEQAVQGLGGLDLLVTNAGGPPPGGIDSLDDSDWQKAVDLSFLSHMRLIRASLPYLRQSSAASVLTITSYSVKQPIPNLLLSNSVRGATIGLTKTLALELGKEGIRFNSILPAWTETERLYSLLKARAAANGTSVEEEIAIQAKDSAIGRMGTLEEFANAAVFLLSPAASYITGVMLSIDGGLYKATY